MSYQWILLLLNIDNSIALKNKTNYNQLWYDIRFIVGWENVFTNK